MRKMSIERALQWAFREELPKDEPDSRTFAPKLAQGGNSLDVGVDNRWGVVASLAGDGPAHPDAQIIGGEVLALEGSEIGMPEGWNPLSDLGLTDGEAAAVLAGFRLAGCMQAHDLVRKHALLRDAPVWEAEVPERKLLKAERSGNPKWFRKVLQPYLTADNRTEYREIETPDGFDVTKRRPHEGAYTKTALDPDPKYALRDRAEYEIWRIALDVLFEALHGRLSEIVLEPSNQPIRPWESGPVEKARVLTDVHRRGIDIAEQQKHQRAQAIAFRKATRIVGEKMRQA